MSADRYEDERFNSVCPTCGQTFLRERVDQLTTIAVQAVAAFQILAKYSEGEDKALFLKREAEARAVLKNAGVI